MSSGQNEKPMGKSGIEMGGSDAPEESMNNNQENVTSSIFPVSELTQISHRRFTGPK